MLATVEPRRAWQLALGCWLPFAACAVVDRLVGVQVEPVMRDLGTHARMLLAIPLYVLGERLLRQRIGEVLLRLGREELVGDLRRLERLAGGVERFVGGRVVTIGLAAIGISAGQAQFWWHDRAYGPASVWYAWLAFPVFAFFGLRYCLRWLMWIWAAWQLARMRLRTAPLHPDRAGGIGFVGLPIAGFLPLVLGSTAVAAAHWASLIHHGGATLLKLREPVAMGLAVACVAAVVPYLAFAGVLLRTRRRGLRQYEHLALTYVRRFSTRWIDEEPGPELLGTSDIQSLNDLGGAYEVVRRIRLVPFDPLVLVSVAAAVVVPFVPVLLMAVPLSTLLVRAARSVIGGG